jgi:sugar diacid utilization regulator
MTEVAEQVAQRLVSGEADVSPEDIRAMQLVGSSAAEHGLTAVEVVELYLTTAARVWHTAEASTAAPSPAAQSLLTAIRAVVPALIEGYQNTGRRIIRQEETARQELVDDLIRGDADIAGLVQRSEPFGLDLGSRHQIVLAEPRDAGEAGPLDEATLSRAVTAQYGERDTLVTRRSRQLVALIPARQAGSDLDDPARRLHEVLRRSTPGRSWRVAVGRPFAGAHGIARSYQEAREAVTLVERLHPEADLVPTRNLLIYRVLGRDRAALTDLVESVLVPLQRARGGAGPLIATLEAYFAAGAVATETARRLHVSVRTVTYRLDRDASLTGYNPALPTERLTLQVAVLGARLLPWPPTPT